LTRSVLESAQRAEGGSRPVERVDSPLFGELLLKLGLVTFNQIQEALALQSLNGQRLGEALISLGYVTRAQIQDALGEALGLHQPSPGLNTPVQPPLGELLVNLKYLTLTQLDEALALQRRTGRKLGEILVEHGYCTYKQLYEGLGLQGRISARGRAGPDAATGARRGRGGRRPAAHALAEPHQLVTTSVIRHPSRLPVALSHPPFVTSARTLPATHRRRTSCFVSFRLLRRR